MDSPWRRVLEALPVGSVVDFVVGGQVNHTVIRCESGGAGAGGFSILSGRDWLSVASWPDEVPDSTLRVVLDRSRGDSPCPE